MVKRRKQRQHPEAGQALVEFSLTLPILVITLVGFTALSYVFYAWIVMNHATSEGVNYAMRHPTASETTILNEGVLPNLTGLIGTPSVTVSRTGNQVTITAFYVFNLPTVKIPLLLSNDSVTIMQPFTFQVTSIGFY